MARPTRQEQVAVLERRHKVMRRYARGELQVELARAFEVCQQTISDDIAWVHERWLADSKQANAERVAAELGRIAEVERTAWQAWARSQENAEVLKARMKGQDAVTEKTSKGQAGDPRFLELVLKCVARRCELLGLDAEKGEGPADEDVPLDERRAALLGVLAAIRHRPGAGPHSGAPAGHG